MSERDLIEGPNSACGLTGCSLYTRYCLGYWLQRKTFESLTLEPTRSQKDLQADEMIH